MEKTILTLLALATLTACDHAVRSDIRGERTDGQYRAAMDDYRAGRMDKAIAGFEKAVRNDPANSSARFQLACLRQELKKDYLAAYCGYREFLLQQPGSDRAKLARDRMAVCEREVAAALASKYDLCDSGTVNAAGLETLQAELRALRGRLAAAEKDLAAAQGSVRALTDERNRLVSAIKGEGVGDDVARGGDLAGMLKEKDLLDEDDESLAGPSLIPVAPPDDLNENENMVAEKRVERPVKKRDAASARDVPERPKTYVVEDGDTLYGISKRFYGGIQSWRKIREANKALISSDNRLRAGDTLALP